MATTTANTKPKFDVSRLNIPFLMACDADRLNPAICLCGSVFLTAVVCALFVALLKGNEQVSRINKGDLFGSAAEFEID